MSQDGTNVSGFFLGYRNDAGGAWEFYLPGVDDLQNPAGALVRAPVPAQLGTWTHVAGVYDAEAKKIRIYVNGVPGGTADFNGGFHASGSLVMGRGKWNGGPVSQWPGAVDEVQMYDRAASEAEIRSTVGRANVQVADWRFDDGSGTTARNAVEGGQAAVLHNGASFTNEGAVKGSLVLDGVDDHAATTGPVMRTDQSFSVAAWVKLARTDGNSYTVLSQDGSRICGFCLQYQGNTREWVFVMPRSDEDNPASYDFVKSASVVEGQWTHLTGVHLRRLTEAWTPTTTGCAADPAAGQLGGPAPYWHSYAYDKVGNRRAETQHATAGDITRTYAYPAAGQPQPHTLTSVSTTGTGTETFGYNQTGDTIRRTKSGVDESLGWDPEGHLASATKNGQTTSFVYTPDGQRLLRKDPAGTTLYLSNQEVRLDTGSTTPVGVRYYVFGGKTIAARKGAALTWLANDHQGSPQIAINSQSQGATHRRQFPFGAPRGAQPSGWPGEKGFVGGTQDSSTGLTHLGAREYDPLTGRFLSVDPIMDPADPQQINGYSYANNSPVTFSDPTGLRPAGCEEMGLNCRTGGPLNRPEPTEGPGSADTHPRDHTTKHNAVARSAGERIAGQAMALGYKVKKLEYDVYIPGASKKCADTNWNQIPGCGRHGFADIVLTVELCPTPGSCYDMHYVWEVKSVGQDGIGGRAAAEAEWYARHLERMPTEKDPKMIGAAAGWEIGGPYRMEVTAYQKTQYWGTQRGSVVYGDDDDDKAQNRLNIAKDTGQLEFFNADSDRWKDWNQHKKQQQSQPESCGCQPRANDPPVVIPFMPPVPVAVPYIRIPILAR